MPNITVSSSFILGLARVDFHTLQVAGKFEHFKGGGRVIVGMKKICAGWLTFKH